ncbi:hypothetical protein BCY86_08185 [Pajaroellobacter abortibovis]|uniref:Uncharacterized protein n=1 Tax=Pajaroellobacter abortibovis TaxID=1882918 RepID=A0A1L6MYR2_9BACT|nr:hypothetical protein BCY86_08185 [Pajaroellobacter abortibovis]
MQVYTLFFFSSFAYRRGLEHHALNLSYRKINRNISQQKKMEFGIVPTQPSIFQREDNKELHLKPIGKSSFPL